MGKKENIDQLRRHNRDLHHSCKCTALNVTRNSFVATNQVRKKLHFPFNVPFKIYILTASAGFIVDRLALQVNVGRVVSLRHRLVTHLNLGCHHHESLLYVSRVFGGCLNKFNTQGIGKFLS